MSKKTRHWTTVYREILEEKVAPLVLHVEEKTKDETAIHQGNHHLTGDRLRKHIFMDYYDCGSTITNRGRGSHNVFNLYYWWGWKIVHQDFLPQPPFHCLATWWASETWAAGAGGVRRAGGEGGAGGVWWPVGGGLNTEVEKWVKFCAASPPVRGDMRVCSGADRSITPPPAHTRHKR